MSRPSSLPLRTYLSDAPRHERIRYSVLACPLNVCRSPPFALSNSLIVESSVDTSTQLLSNDCATEVIGSSKLVYILVEDLIRPMTSVDN